MCFVVFTFQWACIYTHIQRHDRPQFILWFAYVDKFSTLILYNDTTLKWQRPAIKANELFLNLSILAAVLSCNIILFLELCFSNPMPLNGRCASGVSQKCYQPFYLSFFIPANELCFNHNLYDHL